MFEKVFEASSTTFLIGPSPIIFIENISLSRFLIKVNSSLIPLFLINLPTYIKLTLLTSLLLMANLLIGIELSIE